jgi:TRAP-type C4-dicarboxylate transport system permease small subunit
MNSLRLASLVLMVGCALALAYGGFSYTRDTHELNLGPLQVQVQERKYLNIPIWAGLASLLAGVALLAASARRIR